LSTAAAQQVLFRVVTSWRHPLAVLAVAIVALAATAGCGREQEPDLVKGKTLFAEKCAGCHVLERANATGVQGPNLDLAFAGSRADGLGEQTVAGVVERQILHPNGRMPAKLYDGQDAKDVAAYVATVAGQPGEDKGALASAGAPKVSTKPVVAEKGVLDIDADPTGALAFISTKAEAPAGSVEFEMDNESPVPHNIAAANAGGKLLGEGPAVGKGGTSKFAAKLKPGEYQFLCTVPGHSEGGMKGTLTVK